MEIFDSNEYQSRESKYMIYYMTIFLIVMPGDFFSAGGEIKKEKDAVERNQWQSDVSSHLKLTVQACDLQFQRCE